MVRSVRLARWTGWLAVFAALLAALPGAARAEGDLGAWLAKLRAEAAAKGIRATTLDAALAGFAPIPRVIELDRRQPEFTLTFNQYLTRVVPEARVRKGRRALKENLAQLQAIAKRFGVQPRFIVAFWGIETDFGRLSGGFPVIRALGTLAYDGRRSRYFRKELINALHILDAGHITAKRMTGSWAGAMGQFQFMPSSFLAYAMDDDGDGRKDIWQNRADAFASAANYLKRSGWKGDQTWGRAVRLADGFDLRLAGLKIRKRLSAWQKLGVRRADGRDLPRRDLQASLILADKGKRAPFLVYDNYRVTLKWNRSTFFAVAVGTLAERIRGD